MTSDPPTPSGPALPQLSNRLGPRRRQKPDQSSTPAAAPPGPRGAEQSRTAQSRTAASRGEQPARTAESRPASPSRKSRHVQISLPSELERQLREYARSSGLSKAVVVFRAITAVREELPDLVSATVDAPLPEGELFRGAVAAAPKTRRHVPTGIYMTPEDLATLDRLVKQVNAPDRSGFVATALQAWFATKPG